MNFLKKILTKKNNNTLQASIENNRNIGQYCCSVCKSNNISMRPLSMHYLTEMHKYGHVYNIFYLETINFAHYSCSVCGASDRARLYALYLEKYFKENLNISINLLDIAPDDCLSKYLKAYPNLKYRSMDLYMENVDDKLDITNMISYEDNKFDFLICSHVLEHIPNDIKAMQEIYRVLKPGGKGIVMVPINLAVETTIEDPLCDDIPTRWKYYGQDDHIRMYSKRDFIERLTNVGFNVQLLDFNHFGLDVFEKNAIFERSVLYIVNK